MDKEIIMDLWNEKQRLLFVKDNMVDISWNHEGKTQEQKQKYKNALNAIYAAINCIDEITGHGQA